MGHYSKLTAAISSSIATSSTSLLKPNPRATWPNSGTRQARRCEGTSLRKWISLVAVKNAPRLTRRCTQSAAPAAYTPVRQLIFAEGKVSTRLAGFLKFHSLPSRISSAEQKMFLGNTGEHCAAASQFAWEIGQGHTSCYGLNFVYYLGSFLRHRVCPQEAFRFEDGFMYISNAPRLRVESGFLDRGRAST